MTMGRPPLGPSSVESLDGAAAEKERLRVILETLTGELTVTDACFELGLQRSRFHELRVKALQGALEALAPGLPGRPRKQAPREREHSLQLENTRLRRQLDGARVRAELALAMPGLVRVFSEPEKGVAKTRDRRRRARKKGTTRG